MDVIINYLDGSRKVYENCDDIDVDPDYIDVYTDPAGEDDPCIGLDLNIIKSVFTETILPGGSKQTDRVYFNKKPAKVNSKKEVNTMSTNENIKEQLTPAEAAENNEDDDFDFAESFNRRGRLFTIDTEGMEGHKASEVFKEIGDAPLIMKAIFINKDTGYGESVSVVTNNSVIYFSKANLEAAHNIRDNQKAVDKINEKGAFFRITEFEAKKYKKKGYSFEFLKKNEIPAEFTGEEPCFKW